MLQNLGGWHLLIILAVVLLIFGAARLPVLARSVGQSVRILRKEGRALEKDRSEDDAPTTVEDAASAAGR